MKRISNKKVREAYLRAHAIGVHPGDVCRRVGMMRKNKPNTTDPDRLHRCLGITPAGRGIMLQTIRNDLAKNVMSALRELTRYRCDDCGSVLLEQDDLCGLCKLESETMVAA